jgi:aspartyl-tRNA(Asn)/glutamyl-tRNA(Gln) amidotransferase subunit C
LTGHIFSFPHETRLPLCFFFSASPLFVSLVSLSLSCYIHSMPISKADVEHVALLARLRLTEDEKEMFTVQLGQILEHAGKIAELDTADIEPTSHAVPTVNVFRTDEVGPELSVEEALSNAPEREGDAFGVPKIV